MLFRSVDLNQVRGASRKEFLSPAGLVEICVIPKKWSGAAFRNDDIADENEMCALDMYRNAGLCPKYSSTNPAILLIEPNAKYSKQQIDASSCQIDALDFEVEGKFKQSITCSYTPSILAYYQVSRILGNINRVPVSVIRSMDRDRKITRLNSSHTDISRMPSSA
mgnify:CR=1 FL=1